MANIKNIQRSRIFRGYSSVNKTTPNTDLIDIDLVKRDLLNHFNTIRGERVMRPNFGSIIWDMLFDPFDADTREAIIADARRIIESEPRVQLQRLNVTDFDQGLRIDIDVLYQPFLVAGTFAVDFDRRNNQSGTATLIDKTIEDL
jgi:phage baseplate assembly protein W